MSEKSRKKNETFRTFPFPDSQTHVCGGCFVRRKTLHFMCGYNLPDIMSRKFLESRSDQLQAQMTLLRTDPDWIYETKELSFSRLIAPSVVYSPEFEQSYIFGGIFEEFGKNADLKAVFVSSQLFVHKWQPESVFLLPWTLFQPKDRLFHGAAWDSDRLCMWVFGGGNIKEPAQFFNDLWCWSEVSHQWTPFETIDPCSPRWGVAFAYHNHKLYLLGGSSKFGTNLRSMFILDLNGNRKWKKVNLPENVANKSHGVSITFCHVPKLGVRLILAGGSNDKIYRSIGFSASLHIEQSPDDFTKLTLWSFDPITFDFEELIVPPELRIPNVSYHSAAFADDKLFLVGGINHCSKGRTFHQSVIVIDIPSLFKQQKPELFFVQKTLPYQPPIESQNDLFGELYQSFENQIQIWRSSENTCSLVAKFFQHQKNPSPLSSFYLVNKTFVSKDFFHKKIGPFTKDFCRIADPFDRDLGLFVYSSSIFPEVDLFQFQDFVDFILTLHSYNLIHLILLELSSHMRFLPPLAIVQLCATKIKKTSSFLMDDPQLKVLKFAFWTVIKLKKDIFTTQDLMSIHSLSEISHLLLPLLDHSKTRFLDGLYDLIPSSLVISGIDDFYTLQPGSMSTKQIIDSIFDE